MSGTLRQGNSYSPSSTLHVVNWSGGKDSTATILLLHEHERELLRPGDRVVILFSEVMFDLRNNISGHNPDIIRFIYEKKETFESWGYEVNILRAERDYLDVFFHLMRRSSEPDRVGRVYGFPHFGICAIKRDCKLRPIEDWHRAHQDSNIIKYIGIAADEPRRLVSMHRLGENTVSLLEKYGYTEADAFELCREYDMLSPQYSLPGVMRDGCWFCPCAKMYEHAAVASAYPQAWAKYVSLENIPGLVYPKWNIYSQETLRERAEAIEREII